MARAKITEQSLMDHVVRLGYEHPPVSLGSVDRTIHRPELVRSRFTTTLDYLARVELEVDRNVLELLTILPSASEVDRTFYQDVWYHQEMAHGYLLDQLQADLGLPTAEPYMPIPLSMKVLGAMAHWEPIHDVARFLYYLTGAATERQAVLAYSRLIDELQQMGEPEIAETIIHPIKRQEPGHFAFYQMSATKMIQDDELKPWQLFLARVLRSSSFALVGTNGRKEYQTDMGGVVVELGMDEELEDYAKQIGRLEARLLWANKNGMEFPAYFLKALRESVDLYRGQGDFTRPDHATEVTRPDQ